MVLISCRDSVDPKGHNAAGRIKLTAKSNDVIRNGTRDLPACSIAPQPGAIVSIVGLFYETVGIYTRIRVYSTEWYRKDLKGFIKYQNTSVRDKC
jgi:hypothetical protein